MPNTNNKITVASALSESLAEYNKAKQSSWTLGMNYDNTNTQFETYVNHYLFPKMRETIPILTKLGNRFNFLAKEIENIGQLTEEYAILDALPVDLDLTISETEMFKRNYPKMITKLYGQGVHKKTKFTLNDNSNRLNWSTLGDAIKYTTNVYEKRISDINVLEEAEIKSMLVDYANNYLTSTKQALAAVDIDDFTNKISTAILHLQNNSSNYNESKLASGGSVGRYTTQSQLKNLLIVTTDDIKAYLLDTKLANTFQIAGIDLTSHIISFDDLGGTYKITKDSTVQESDIDKFRAFGDYQIKAGQTIPNGAVYTFDITDFDSFKGNFEEIKPAGKNFALIMDKDAVKYERNTDKLTPTQFYNNELDEYTYWLHYYSFKSISPFYNKIKVTLN